MQRGHDWGTIATPKPAQIRLTASYDCYAPVSLIAEYLGRQIEESAHGDPRVTRLAAALRERSLSPLAFFAQAWCEAIGYKRLERGNSQ
jgi:hypothetical protein